MSLDLDGALDGIRKKHTEKSETPIDTRPVGERKQRSLIEEKNIIRAKYGYPLLEETTVQETANDVKEEDPIHPTQTLSPQMLEFKYGNDIVKGYTKEQLEAFASSGMENAARELQRRRIVELERENVRITKDNAANLKAIEDQIEADKHKAAVEARVKELEFDAAHGVPGAIGEILKLRGKL